MSSSHFLELARLESEAHWNRTLAQAQVAPGSSEESAALARIDELREEDVEGLLRGHPDAKKGTGLSGSLFYRRSATASQLASRRSAATRYWRRSMR